MKEIFLLTKTLLKSSTNDSKKIGEKSSKRIGKILFFVLVYGYIIGLVSYISYYAINSLITVNQPAAFLNIAFVVMLRILRYTDYNYKYKYIIFFKRFRIFTTIASDSN